MHNLEFFGSASIWPPNSLWRPSMLSEEGYL
jgi:hypothetical protein